jgi:hypothetical protein
MQMSTRYNTDSFTAEILYCDNAAMCSDPTSSFYGYTDSSELLYPEGSIYYVIPNHVDLRNITIYEVSFFVYMVTNGSVTIETASGPVQIDFAVSLYSLYIGYILFV